MYVEHYRNHGRCNFCLRNVQFWYFPFYFQWEKSGNFAKIQLLGSFFFYGSQWRNVGGYYLGCGNRVGDCCCRCYYYLGVYKEVQFPKILHLLCLYGGLQVKSCKPNGLQLWFTVLCLARHQSSNPAIFFLPLFANTGTDQVAVTYQSFPAHTIPKVFWNITQGGWPIGCYLKCCKRLLSRPM